MFAEPMDDDDDDDDDSDYDYDYDDVEAPSSNVLVVLVVCAVIWLCEILIHTLYVLLPH